MSIVILCAAHGVQSCRCGGPTVMATTYIEQAIAEGKPVDTIPGLNPQFGSKYRKPSDPTRPTFGR